MSKFRQWKKVHLKNTWTMYAWTLCAFWCYINDINSKFKWWGAMFLFFNFVMLPHWQSSTRKFTFVWLWTSYERKKFIRIVLHHGYMLKQCIKTWWFFFFKFIFGDLLKERFNIKIIFKNNLPNDENCHKNTDGWEILKFG